VGKSNKREPARGRREDTGFVNLPFKELEGTVIPVAPCLMCGKEVDTRLNWSASRLRGAKKTQRQGYLHEECLKRAEGPDVMVPGPLHPKTGKQLEPVAWEPFARMFGSSNRFSPVNEKFLKKIPEVKLALNTKYEGERAVVRLGELVVATTLRLEVPVFTDEELQQIVDSDTRS